MEKVSIIGAGTAGLIAARRLGSNGIEATVYDQKHELGLPVRASGILSISGLSTIGIDYSSCITNRLVGANIHCGRSTMEVRSKAPMAYILDRKRLNDACHDHAVAAGASVITCTRMMGKDIDALAREGVVVGADGAVSTVARHFGMGDTGSQVLTWKAEFNCSAPDDGMVELFFDNTKFRGLFAWMAPNYKDVLEVGVGIDSRYGNAKSAFARFIEMPEVRSVIGGKRLMNEYGSIIPMAMRKRIVDDARKVMLIGDAAGQIKPTTGGGIIYGGNAALMAADAITGYMNGTGKLSDYSRRFMKAYGLDLRMHSAINTFYSAFGPRALSYMVDVAKLFEIDSFLGRYGDMDMPSVMLKRFFLRDLAV